MAADEPGPLDNAGENEFRWRRTLTALSQGDIVTAKAIGGAERVEEARWSSAVMRSVLKLRNVLAIPRVRAVAIEARRGSRDPEESPETDLFETIAAFLRSGEISRIGRMAEEAARAPSNDRRAKAILAGRIDDLHTVEVLHRLWTAYTPRGAKQAQVIEARRRTLEELAGQTVWVPSDADAERRADEHAEECAAIAATLWNEQADRFGVRVDSKGGQRYRIEVRGLSGRRATKRYEQATRGHAGIGIAGALAIGLRWMYEDARDRPIRAHEMEVLKLDAGRQSTEEIECRVASPLLESYLKRTSRGRRDNEEQIIRTATTIGIQALLESNRG